MKFQEFWRKLDWIKVKLIKKDYLSFIFLCEICEKDNIKKLTLKHTKKK